MLGAWGEARAVADAYEQAWLRFRTVLQELVDELPALRRPVEEATRVRGPVARRMVAACWPHRARFITPMAAVAGAVAEEILAAMVAAGALERAYANNGGDIALHVAPGARLRIGLVVDPTQRVRHGHRPALDGAFEIAHAAPVRGVATSGWRGRSRSLGIADSVTVLAPTAAAADAAATMIANAVDADHPAIERRPANLLDDDSDLGARRVTTAVGRLPADVIAAALDAGATHAEALAARGLIESAALALQGDVRVAGAGAAGRRSLATVGAGCV